MIIKRIVLHHSGSQATYDQLQRYWWSHNKKCPYHYLIDYNGQLIKGRQDTEKGAHIRNMNTGSLGVCLLGDYTIHEPGGRQMAELDYLLTFLIASYLPTLEEVVPHNKYVKTICPGKHLTEYAEDYGMMNMQDKIIH